MKILIVGFGNQGQKRKNILKKSEYFGSYDPFVKNSSFKNLSELPIRDFDTVFICTPDDKKFKLSKYFLLHKKNILIEKPLYLKIKEINFIYRLAKKNNCFFYTAYNHRFEPNILRIKNELQLYKSKIYYIKLFYGNGTVIDVKSNKWKKDKLGVISDLIPHLLDTLIFTLGYKKIDKITLHTASNFESKKIDHSIISFLYGDIFVELEVSLCSWKNNFKYDIYSKKNSFHIESLCKWGHTSYIRYNRKIPSGYPKIYSDIKKNTKDPTWRLEHFDFFKNLKNLSFNSHSSSKRDILISKFLNNISELF